jgi:hypothetical protein
MIYSYNINLGVFLDFETGEDENEEVITMIIADQSSRLNIKAYKNMFTWNFICGSFKTQGE